MVEINNNNNNNNNNSTEQEYRAFKKAEQRKLCNETRKADAATRHVVTSDITQSNKLARAVTHWVGTQERLENEDKRQP